MEIVESLRQGVFWLVVVITFVALSTVISWPRLKGKAWLVAFLAMIFLQQFYFRTLDAVVHFSTDEPRFELYRTFAALTLLVVLSAVPAHVFLVIGLLHLRSFLKAAVTYSPTAIDHQSMPSAPIRSSWTAKGGTFVGPYRVNDRNAVALARKATLLLHEDGSLILKAKYDPPGSALYALLATIVSGVVFGVMLAALGFAASPGWLVWYIVIVLVRRRPIAFNLADAETVIVDPTTSRVAFRILFEGVSRWIAVELHSDFQSADKALKALIPSKVSEGTVLNPSMLLVFLLLALIFGIVAVIILLVTQLSF